MKNTKLELTWIGKDERPGLEPRILLEDERLSYHARQRVTEHDRFDNRLIHGDNLLGLKAIEQEFTNRIKCVYIDPPFNTGGAFEYYDDSREHSLWLGMMRDRLEIIHRLLAPEGALVVNLDDTECAYCKVLLDEIFGRTNYVLTIVVEAATPSSFKTVNTGPTEVAQYLLLYAKDKANFRYHQQFTPIYEIDLQHFSRFIVDPTEPPEKWTFQSINDHVLGELGYSGATTNAKWAAIKAQLGADEAQTVVRERALEFALANCDRVFETKTLQKPSKWLHDHITQSRATEYVVELPRDGMESIYLYKGRQLYFLGKGVREVDGTRVVTQPITNIWDDIPTNNLQREGNVDFPAGKKPEALILRVIRMIADQSNDIILDSFGGSGTTAAVAHKLRRPWIVIERGEQCETHIVPRLRGVIDGTDETGITQAVHWEGGGGFRYFRLAPSLLERDKYGNWVINKEYNPAMLAEAMCKHEGFTYAPSDSVYWQQGQSTERDFIYVTTQTLGREQLAQLSEEVGPDRSLLICCGAYRANVDEFPNLTVQKIPNAVLHNCEWGRDDYSLAVSQLREVAESDDSPVADTQATTPANKSRRKRRSPEPELFEDAES